MKPNNICEDCWRWKKYKHECMFFWEGKTECSKFKFSEDSEDKFVTDEKLIYGR